MCHEVEGLASQPVGYMLLSALYRCELELGNEHNAGAIGTLLAASAKQRGPRTAAVVAALGVVAKAKADFDRFPYEAERMVPWGSGPQDMGALGDQNEVDWAGQSGRNYQAYAAAVVKSVTPVGDRVKVEYRTERFQVPTYNCVLTDKISRITSDGRVLYRQNCTKTGMEWKESTEAPITLDAAVATGITAGAFVRARRENDLGYPMEVYSDASKANLVAYFGVPLK